MTKARTAKLLKDVDDLGGVTRYLVACFRALGLIHATEGENGERNTFVDPETFSHLAVLKRGFIGRFTWLLLGK